MSWPSDLMSALCGPLVELQAIPVVIRRERVREWATGCLSCCYRYNLLKSPGQSLVMSGKGNVARNSVAGDSLLLHSNALRCNVVCSRDLFLADNKRKEKRIILPSN